MDKGDSTFEKSPCYAPCVITARLALEHALGKKWCVRCAGRLCLVGTKATVQCRDCGTTEWRLPLTPLPFIRVDSYEDREAVGGPTVYYSALAFDGWNGRRGPWMRSDDAALRRMAPMLAGHAFAFHGLVTYERYHEANQTVPRDYVRATWRHGPPVVGPWMHTAERAFAQVLERLDGPQLRPLVREVAILTAEDVASWSPST